MTQKSPNVRAPRNVIVQQNPKVDISTALHS